MKWLKIIVFSLFALDESNEGGWGWLLLCLGFCSFRILHWCEDTAAWVSNVFSYEVTDGLIWRTVLHKGDIWKVFALNFVMKSFLEILVSVESTCVFPVVPCELIWSCKFPRTPLPRTFIGLFTSMSPATQNVSYFSQIQFSAWIFEEFNVTAE